MSQQADPDRDPDPDAPAVKGFDPRLDTPTTADQARIRLMYERLRERDKPGAGRGLRHEPDLTRQRQLLAKYPNFDSKHDPPELRTVDAILGVYEDLLAAGFEDEAAALRLLPTRHDQRQRGMASRRDLLGGTDGTPEDAPDVISGVAILNS